MLTIKRKLWRPFDAALIAAIVICALVFFLPFKSANTTAIITVDGKTVKEIDLKNAQDGVFTLDEAPDVTLEIKDGKIAFVNAKCCDGLCEKRGFLFRAGDTAACLPNRTVITVKGENLSFDGVSY